MRRIPYILNSTTCVQNCAVQVRKSLFEGLSDCNNIEIGENYLACCAT